MTKKLIDKEYYYVQYVEIDGRLNPIEICLYDDERAEFFMCGERKPSPVSDYNVIGKVPKHR